LVLALALLSLLLSLSLSSSGAADDDVDCTMRGIMSLFCFFVLFRFLIFNGLSGDGTTGSSSDALSCRPDALETFPRLTQQQQQRRITIKVTAILATSLERRDYRINTCHQRPVWYRSQTTELRGPALFTGVLRVVCCNLTPVLTPDAHRMFSFFFIYGCKYLS
jgi:hypothetical protein